jgi:Na+/H+ antiporter NhaD/arsenite permease-like protein
MLGGDADSPSDSPVFASIAMLVYLLIWLLLMRPDILPLGRPGTAMVGAALMLILREAQSTVFPKTSSFDAFGTIDWDPITLLFGLMVVNHYMEATDYIHRFEALLDHARPARRIVNIVAMSTLISPLLMNDTVCLAFTPIVLRMCAKHRVKATLPYLMALVTSANIGSALTVTGNPQNSLIQSIDARLTFSRFVARQCLPTIVTQALNLLLLLAYFREDLRDDGGGGGNGGADPLLPLAAEAAAADTAAAAAAAGAAGAAASTHRRTKSNATTDGLGEGSAHRFFGRAFGVFFVIMVAMFVIGLDVDGVAMAMAMALLLLHALLRSCRVRRAMRRTQAGRESSIDMRGGGSLGLGLLDAKTETDVVLAKVDFGLLLLFIGQFVLVGAVVQTGVPKSFFDSMLGSGCSGASMVAPGCVWWFGVIVIVLSNVISNVPVILMLKPLLVGVPNADKVWLVVSFVATVAGNLCMLGSAANLIVEHQASKLGDRSMTAMAHAKYGVPSTILVAAVGIFMLAHPLW